jgi:hypothetical protein
MSKTPLKPSFAKDSKPLEKKEPIKKKEEPVFQDEEEVDGLLNTKLSFKCFLIVGASAAVIGLAAIGIVNITKTDQVKENVVNTENNEIYRSEAKDMYSMHEDEYKISQDKFISEYEKYREEGATPDEAYASVENDNVIINLEEEEEEIEDQTVKDDNTIPLPYEFIKENKDIQVETEPKESTKTIKDLEGNEVELTYDPEVQGYVVEITTEED